MENKKFTYRPDEDIQELIDKGLKMYRGECKTNNFSINQLISVCIRKAVKDLPQFIKDQEKEYAVMKSKYINEKDIREKTQEELEELRATIQKKLDIEAQIIKMIN